MARALGPAAGLLWVAACVAWFDPAAPLRPAGLPPWVGGGMLVLAAAAAVAWAFARREALAGPPLPGAGGLLLVVGLAVAFRLPLAWHGGAGYVTPDGALSGIVALHLRDGIEHLVFVPRVPYSGSLKSHFTAVLAAGGLDPARAFALASVAFYAAFVAAAYRLAQRVGQADGPSAARFLPLAAGTWLAFAPAFVTRYSLSNDGNYVEVLALGTWALVLALRWRDEPGHRATLSWAIGLLVGLAFWCHILAAMHGATVALLLLAWAWRAVPAALPRLAGGFALGYAPGLLWNLFNGGESFLYLLPGGRPVGAVEQGPGLAGRALEMARSQWPVLLGYDPGYPAPWDGLLAAAAVAAVVLALAGLARAAGDGLRGRNPAAGALAAFVLVCTAIAVLALPVIVGNPRYLLFTVAALPVLMARAAPGRPGRVGLALLVAVGAASSLAQAPATLRADEHIRGFARDLEAAGVTRCTTDFFLATKINFVSQEAVICSSELGPTTTEYFESYRAAVARAEQVGLVAVNRAAADKLGRRLDRLGVPYRRLELRKPVLLPARRVGVGELFPDRAPDQPSPSAPSSSDSW